MKSQCSQDSLLRPSFSGRVMAFTAGDKEEVPNTIKEKRESHKEARLFKVEVCHLTPISPRVGPAMNNSGGLFPPSPRPLCSPCSTSTNNSAPPQAPVLQKLHKAGDAKYDKTHVTLFQRQVMLLPSATRSTHLIHHAHS